MRRPRLALLALLAAAACTHPGATPPPDPSAADPAAPTPDPAEGGANFASPPEPGEPPPVPDAAAADPELAARVRARFGDGCRLERVCGDLAGVDCNAAADGPYYYVRSRDLELLSTCGGACMAGKCTECPPPAWTCSTY